MLGVDFIIGIILWLIILKIIIYITAPSIYKGPESLVGKVVLITGGNRGIGFEVSKELARRGCKLIIACRSDAERARQEIINFSNNENVIVKRVDLKSFKSVRQFASEIHQSEKKVDVLINNAGVGFDTILSEDGLNPVLQANIYSAFLLTHLLIDLLKQSDDGRIIFTSSSFAFANNLTIDNLDAHFPGDDQTVHYSILNYGNSKLAQLISSKIFAKKLWEYGIKSNAIHPGIIYTDIFQAMEGKFGIDLCRGGTRYNRVGNVAKTQEHHRTIFLGL
ncbi:hypothetical protein ABEB36_012561 [Hypothenemus hampei]|uniref:Uncharacterized protein n=1 Tax=Hypothenemus hampei TaxID=57062 RepID=A0ABD1EEE4_HYPHA